MERRQFTREFKLEAVRLIKDCGVSYVQASQDLDVHVSQLRDWVKKFSDDPQQAFPGHGQIKPEQLEIARLKREVIKLITKAKKAEASPQMSNCQKGSDFNARENLYGRRSPTPELPKKWVASLTNSLEQSE